MLRQEGSWAVAAAPKGMVFPEGCTAALGFGAVGRNELKLGGGGRSGSSASAGVTSQVGIQLLRLGFSRAELAGPTELGLGLGLGREKQLGKERRARTWASVPCGMSNTC